MKSIFTSLCVMVLAMSAIAQSPVYTPEAGSPERKAILDTVRVPVEKKLDQAVNFKVEIMNIKGDWAFVRGVPQCTDGGKIDYRQTVYLEAVENGAFDDWFCALVRRRAGRWRVVTYAIGATNVVWEPWARQYKAPRAIFQ